MRQTPDGPNTLFTPLDHSTRTYTQLTDRKQSDSTRRSDEKLGVQSVLMLHSGTMGILDVPMVGVLQQK